MAEVTDTLAKAIAIVGAASFSFFVGLIAWGAFASVFLVDALTVVGVSISASDIAALGFVVGGALAVGVVSAVFN